MHLSLHARPAFNINWENGCKPIGYIYRDDYTSYKACRGVGIGTGIGVSTRLTGIVIAIHVDVKSSRRV